MVQFLDLLFSHSLSQRVALAAREIRELAGKKHDLFLINRNAVGVFQVLFHARNVVLYRLFSLLAGDELGNVAHGPWTVEGVHGYEVFEGGGFQFAQVFLHSGAFKLECSDGLSVLIEFECNRVVDRNLVDVYFYSFAQAYIFYGFLQYRQRLEPEEVHLYKSRFFNHGTFVLRADKFFACGFVFGRAHGNPVGDSVATDYNAAGVYAGVSYVSFEHFRVFQRVGKLRVARRCGFAQFRNGCHGVRNIHFRRLSVGAFGKFVGYELAEPVARFERKFLHARHVLYCEFRGHCAVCYYMCHLFESVFPGYPVKHFAASVVVEVDIDIGKAYSVGVKESFKQQVVFYRVYLGYSEAVCHSRACRGATSGAHPYAEFGACGVYVVLHYEKVSGKAHCFHNVQFETQAFCHIVGHRVAVTDFCPFVCELA